MRYFQLSCIKAALLPRDVWQVDNWHNSRCWAGTCRPHVLARRSALSLVMRYSKYWNTVIPRYSMTQSINTICRNALILDLGGPYFARFWQTNWQT